MELDIIRYNLLRDALVANPNEDHDVVRVAPKTFALKKEHEPEVLGCVTDLILNDPKIMNGISPYDSMRRVSNGDQLQTEQMLYVLMAYAVGVQQGWLKLQPALNKYFVNLDHKEIVEYVEDTHRIILDNRM